MPIPAPSPHRPDDPESALRRYAFLAEAGEVLSSSLDYEQTLQHVARLAVPTLADLCIVDVVVDGQLRRVATAHADPKKSALLDELRRRYPAGDGSPQPAARVMRSGASELLPEVTADVVSAHTRNAEHAALIQAIGIRSHLAVPLKARGAIVGVISLGVTESDWLYGPGDVAFAEDLARRAALAVDNARLYREAQNEIADRRRAEAALRLSEARFRAVMEQSPLSTQIFNADGVAIRVNRAWEQLWGVTLESIPEYNVLKDPQLEALGIAPLIRRAFAGEAVHLPVIRYDPHDTIPDRSWHDDPVRWVSAFAYPVKDESGRVREVVLVHEDVTAARKAELQLHASEERLRLALAAGRMNAWDWDLVTDRIECSENAAEFWGIEVGQASDFLAVVHPDDLEVLAGAVQDAAAARAPYDATYRLIKDGAVRWMQSRGRVELGADGQPVRVLGVTVDITDHKAAQEALQLLADAGETLGASLDYHATLQSLTRIAVPRIADWCAVDLLSDSGDLERVAVNHRDPAQIAVAAELFARYPPRRGEADGPWHILESGQPEWSAEITDAMLEGVARTPEHLAMLRALSLHSAIRVPLVARGASIGVLTLVHAESGRRYRESDIDLAKDLARRAAAAVDNARLYEQLRAEDRRKDEFLATLAHELRNPLAPIRTGLALLRMSRDEDALEKTRQIMERQLGHMVRLVDDLLDLSRVTRGRVQLERERVDLWSIVGAALETSRPALDAAGLQLVVRLPPEPVVLDADRTRLAQVLSNLLNNAAKFTETGGSVEIDAIQEGASVLVRVTDTGVGIPRDMLGHVFEMFAQVGGSVARSQGGLGIGLTLVKRLVELHGGQVWAESDGPGEGSSFVLRLPVSAAPATEQELAILEPLHASSPSTRRILVVDDNADVADTLAALLTLDGHEVRTAANGTTALAVAAELRPHIAFLDIGLPGMDGYELARRLRSDAMLPAMMLVAVTGWGQAEDRRRAREAGFDDHLTKPVAPADVQAFVDRAPRG